MARSNEHQISPATASDNALVGAARDALGRSAEVDTRDIKVDAGNGIIYLTGVVRTLYEKRVAGSLAGNTPGSAGVANKLVVVPDGQPDDREIRECVEQALGNYPEGRPAKIGVRLIEDGTAYLTGRANNVLEVYRAEDMASRVAGVKDIVNEIDVAPGQPMDDITIEELVTDALSEDPLIDPFEINVKVQDGEVCLEGEVDDDEAIRTAGIRASGTTGVKRVVNRLKVREG